MVAGGGCLLMSADGLDTMPLEDASRIAKI